MSENEQNLPSINVNIPDGISVPSEKKQLIPDEKIASVYEEAINAIREDRAEADFAYKTFLELVTNGGDASSSSKEAMVNLLKIKTESNDKLIKVLDLWTRIHLRDRDTMPKYLAVQQNNKIEGTTRAPRQMLQMLTALNPQEEKNEN